jgi:hypothetical protein
MNCADFEILLADYIDGALGEAENAALEQHASTCTGCRELLADASGAVNFLKRADEIVPPPELITRIAFQAPAGRTREPFERQGFLSRLTSKWLQPVLQPRLAMGMAMTILSFAMLERCTGVHVQHIQAADLNPVRIWGGLEDRTVRAKDRVVKYYENLRWVYEIETRLKALQDQAGTTQDPTQDKNSAGQRNQRMNNDSQGATTPDQGNKK